MPADRHILFVSDKIQYIVFARKTVHIPGGFLLHEKAHGLPSVGLSEEKYRKCERGGTLM